MNRNEHADIREKLRHLRRVAASPQFESLLRQKIRAVRSRNRSLGWSTRPVPVALVAAAGTLLIAAYFLSPYYSSNSPSLTGSGPTGMPSDGNVQQLPGENLPGKTQVGAPYDIDSLSVDSASTKRNDVNTLKMP